MTGAGAPAMRVDLATTWTPRGELSRLLAARGALEGLYRRIVVVIPLAETEEARACYAALREVGSSRLEVLLSPRPLRSRQVALERCLQLGAEHVHYCDMDLLLHWLEVARADLTGATRAMTGTDLLIVTRTARADATRPEALRRTEHVINLVCSHLLGFERVVDVCVGSRGLSRRACEVVLARGSEALWVEGEWPVLVQRAGYEVSTYESDGVEWETPDQYLSTVAGPAVRARIASELDRDATEWSRRVEVARRVIEHAHGALSR
jgi:hypothetical protein